MSVYVYTPANHLAPADLDKIAARRDQQFYALRYDCPTCGATPHRHCRTRSGRHTKPHATRKANR